MTFLFEVTRLLAIAENCHLVIAAFFQNFARDLGAGDVRSAELYGVAIDRKEDSIKIHLGADTLGTFQRFDIDSIPVFDEVLLRAGLNNREFGHRGYCTTWLAAPQAAS